jgi:hypothetical protein
MLQGLDARNPSHTVIQKDYVGIFGSGFLDTGFSTVCGRYPCPQVSQDSINRVPNFGVVVDY